MNIAKRTQINIHIMFCLVTVAFLLLIYIGTAAAADIHVPTDDTTIQGAINNASSYDTIIVAPGKYNENLVVSVDNLTIRSESGSRHTTVQAFSPDNPVFNVKANSVTISGFNISGVKRKNSGIYLDSVERCSILNNTVSNNYYSIYLSSSSNNTIEKNTVSNNYFGIHLSSSSNNTIEKNTVMYNTVIGISLQFSSNNTIEKNTVSNNYFGICLQSSSNNTIEKNTVSNNYFGIDLNLSSNNTIEKNTVMYNTVVGIYLQSSSNNTLFGNFILKNSRNSNIFSDDSNNYWYMSDQVSGSHIGNYYGDVYRKYSLTESPYQWINTTRDNATWYDTSDNNYSRKVPLGFNLNLDGVNYTDMQVVSNGVIQLIPPGSKELNDDTCESLKYWVDKYPDETFIFALFDNLDSEEEKHVVGSTFPDEQGWYGYTSYLAGDNDSEGNVIPCNLTVIDYHVATYDDYEYGSGYGECPNDFQVVLYENGTIRFNFKRIEYSHFDNSLCSGLYLGNDLSIHTKELIHVARAGQYGNETSFSTPIIRTPSSSYDSDGDGIADSAYDIASHKYYDKQADYYPLVLLSEASAPSTASGSDSASFIVSTTFTNLASVDVDMVELYYKKDGGDWSKYGDSSTGSFTFSNASTGDYYFYTVVTDVYGNIEGLPDDYDSHTSVSINSESNGTDTIKKSNVSVSIGNLIATINDTTEKITVNKSSARIEIIDNNSTLLIKNDGLNLSIFSDGEGFEEVGENWTGNYTGAKIEKVPEISDLGTGLGTVSISYNASLLGNLSALLNENASIESYIERWAPDESIEREFTLAANDVADQIGFAYSLMIETNGMEGITPTNASIVMTAPITYVDAHGGPDRFTVMSSHEGTVSRLETEWSESEDDTDCTFTAYSPEGFSIKALVYYIPKSRPSSGHNGGSGTGEAKIIPTETAAPVETQEIDKEADAPIKSDTLISPSEETDISKEPTASDVTKVSREEEKDERKETPGFEIVFAVSGLLTALYFARKE